MSRLGEAAVPQTTKQLIWGCLTEVDISAVHLGITQPTYGSNIFRGGYLRGHPNKFSRIKLFGYWILDFGFWILDFGFWILVFGFWILDFGFWVFGFWVWD